MCPSDRRTLLNTRQMCFSIRFVKFSTGDLTYSSEKFPNQCKLSLSFSSRESALREYCFILKRTYSVVIGQILCCQLLRRRRVRLLVKLLLFLHKWLQIIRVVNKPSFKDGYISLLFIFWQSPSREINQKHGSQ